MNKKTTLSDVAQSLGVSITLVSMVVNNKGNKYGISPETQQKVWDKIHELNYKPNLLAKGFRTGKTSAIGLIVSDISNRFYAKIARHIEDLAWQNGYTVIICSTDESVDKELRQMGILLERKVEGIIVSSSQTSTKIFEDLVAMEYPFVLIDRNFGNMKFSSVSINNEQGVEMAIEHLYQQGYRKIGMFSISPGYISTIKNRKIGFYNSMQKLSLPIVDDWCIEIPFNQVEQDIPQHLSLLKSNKNLPEAIIAMNNNLASATLLSLKNLGIRIPRDMALISFDDDQSFNFSSPTITAIEQPIEQISHHAFDILMKQINNKTKGIYQAEILPVKLKIRESTSKGC